MNNLTSQNTVVLNTPTALLNRESRTEAPSGAVITTHVLSNEDTDCVTCARCGASWREYDPRTEAFVNDENSFSKKYNSKSCIARKRSQP